MQQRHCYIDFVPSMPVKERLSYGSQLSVLKNLLLGYLFYCPFINAAIYAVNSYFASIWETITNISGKRQLMLFILGVSKYYWKHYSRKITY